MSWLKNLFVRAPDAPAPAPEPENQGQMRMTLEERMAFRRKMAVEAVRSVLASHGLPSAAYLLHVSQVDQRGHRYAIMLELRPLADMRSIDSPGEWQSLESEIIMMAAKRYRVGVDGVFWRMNQRLTTASRMPDPVAHIPDSEWATLPTSGPSPAPRASAPPPPVKPFLPKPSAVPPSTPPRETTASKKAQKNADGFPDTQIEQRADVFEGVSPEELLAFEDAIRQGQSPKQTVKLGHRSYQTDYMPLE